MIFDPNPDKTSMLQAINEVYFGKTPEILAIEKQLDKFRNKYMTEIKFFAEYNSSDSDLLKFNRMIEDYFGFEAFSLSIHHKLFSISAGTVPVYYNYDVTNMNKYLITTKNGFKFDKKAKYTLYIIITTNVIFNPEITSGEILAALLHEIGHNFYIAIHKSGFIFSKITTIYNYIMYSFIKDNIFGNVYNIIKDTNLFKLTVFKLSNYLKRNTSFWAWIEDYIRLYFDVSDDINDIYQNFIKTITLGFSQYKKIPKFIYNKLLNPLTYINSKYSYDNERFADNFATMYGYGPELASGIEKINSVQYNIGFAKIISEIPILNYIYSINIFASISVMLLFDEHPSLLSRFTDQVKLLEREIKKNDIDPKMKKSMQNDINNLNNTIKNMTTITKDIKDPNLISKIYYNALYNATDSKDIKDFLFDNRNKFEIYDDIYNEKLEGGK